MQTVQISRCIHLAAKPCAYACIGRTSKYVPGTNMSEYCAIYLFRTTCDRRKPPNQSDDNQKLHRFVLVNVSQIRSA